MVVNPALLQPHARAQAAWVWGKAGCCGANRSTRPQEKHQQMPTDVHGSRAGTCCTPALMSPLQHRDTAPKEDPQE